MSGALLLVAAAVPAGRPDAEIAAAAAVAAAAALLPDLDEPGSSVARSLGATSRLVAGITRFVARGHRRATHSLIGLAALCALAAWATSRPTGRCVVVGLAAFLAARCAGPWPLRRRSTAAMIGVGVGWWSVTHPVPWVLAALVVGLASHLVGDAITPAGVPLAWPWPRRLAVPLLASSGSRLERLAVPLVAGGVGLGLAASGLAPWTGAVLALIGPPSV